MAISEKVDELKSVLTESTLLSKSLKSSFLPDKEIVKKIIKQRSPSLSLNDIEVMIEGGSKNPFFNYASTDILNNSNLDPNQLQNLSNTLSSQNINSQNLQSSLDLNNIGQSGTNFGDLTQQFENFKNVPGPETLYSLANKTKSAKETQIFPLPQTAPFFTEAQDMKDRLLVCVTMLSSFKETLLKELIRVAIQLATSLPAIAIMAAPLSFNVPGAISHLMLVINALENICKIILSCLPFLGCLSLLDFVIDNIPSNPVVIGIEIVLTFLLSIYKFCSLLSRLVQKLFNAMNNLTKNCEKQKRKFKRKKRRKIKQLREVLKDSKFGPYTTLNSENLEKPFFTSREESNQDEILGFQINGKFISLEDKLSQGYSEDEEDEALELADEIFSFDQRIKIICELEVPENPDDEVDFTKTDLDEDVFEIIRDIKTITNGIESGGEKYVYDAELPDGRIIRDLDLEDVEELEKRFNIIFKSNENLNQ